MLRKAFMIIMLIKVVDIYATYIDCGLAGYAEANITINYLVGLTGSWLVCAPFLLLMGLFNWALFFVLETDWNIGIKVFIWTMACIMLPVSLFGPLSHVIVVLNFSLFSIVFSICVFVLFCAYMKNELVID